MATWQEDVRQALDELEAAHQAALDATDPKDRHVHLGFAQDAASRIAWRCELAVIEDTVAWNQSW